VVAQLANVFSQHGKPQLKVLAEEYIPRKLHLLIILHLLMSLIRYLRSRIYATCTGAGSRRRHSQSPS
jgi:hypothetical protein